MITISVCMIVKNEEMILARCLNSLKEISDEIIIIDTGSTDRTKDVAKNYTDKIYDFEWINDFAAARNYSFSKATKDYIYVADADEVINEENIERFRILKQVLLPEIEIVQMLYSNQLEYGTTYNFDTEYRPKLFKRIRTFHWIDQIHETVEINPIIFDSDIEIIHMPTSNHAGRDFYTFLSLIKKGEQLSKKLVNMYARELFIAGEDKDFIEAKDFFIKLLEDDERTLDEKKDAQCVITRCSRIQNDIHNLMKNSIKGVVDENPASEICYELGEYYYKDQDYKEAIIWYYNAAYESTSLLNIHYGGDYPLKRLSDCYQGLGEEEQARVYEELANEWSIK